MNEQVGGEMTLFELRPGAIFVAGGVYAVKSEYLYQNGQCECVLLESGEYAHFADGNRTRVREVLLPEIEGKKTTEECTMRDAIQEIRELLAETFSFDHFGRLIVKVERDE